MLAVAEAGAETIALAEGLGVDPNGPSRYGLARSQRGPRVLGRHHTPLVGRLNWLEVAQVLETSFPVEVVEGVPVVTAPEEIDITNAAGLRVAVSGALGSGSALVIVDMSRTRFCDSAGLNTLVNADRRARAEDGELRLVIVAETVVRVVALTGVDRVIAIYASLEEALT